MAIILYSLVAVILAVAILFAWRQFDHRADGVAWDHLAELARGEGQRFDLSMVADLPEPARRYFAFTIVPGTPIRTALRIEMTGQLGNGTKDAPNHKKMQASQILAPPHGLVWKVKASALSGSDGAMPDGSWTRFWLFDLLPIVRAGGGDHHRSAFGRVVAEAAFWAPASLLPGDHVRWEAVDDDTARAIVEFGGFTQAVDITVDASGAPTQVVIQRWSNENTKKVFREQPFGGYPSGYQMFDGYRLPTHVEGGNHFGTPDYFPFFIANVSEIGRP
ncbi:hypothetical protein AY599_20350 [Leptolyngbya valderiana BDU 20041]|nr:hypothetical protein AY599_20350 [Leptolyngbya valderiana BDU 20041]